MTADMTPERWKQIEALDHAAHALPAGERAAFLVQASGDDEGLRREVESLLNAPDSGDGFLTGPALAMPADTAHDPRRQTRRRAVVSWRAC